MIFKRKSFRRFNDNLTLSEEELQDINQKIKTLNPLVNEIEIHKAFVRAKRLEALKLYNP